MLFSPNPMFDHLLESSNASSVAYSQFYASYLVWDSVRHLHSKAMLQLVLIHVCVWPGTTSARRCNRSSPDIDEPLW